LLLKLQILLLFFPSARSQKRERILCYKRCANWA